MIPRVSRRTVAYTAIAGVLLVGVGVLAALVFDVRAREAKVETEALPRVEETGSPCRSAKRRGGLPEVLRDFKCGQQAELVGFRLCSDFDLEWCDEFLRQFLIEERREERLEANNGSVSAPSAQSPPPSSGTRGKRGPSGDDGEDAPAPVDDPGETTTTPEQTPRPTPIRDTVCGLLGC